METVKDGYVRIAFKAKIIGALAVHLDEYKDRYNITHRNTGFAVCKGFDFEDRAIAAALEICQQIPNSEMESWSVSEDGKANGSISNAAAKICKAIIDKYDNDRVLLWREVAND